MSDNRAIIDKAFAQAFDLIASTIDNVGADAVEYARQTGNYRDQSGHLRASNKYESSIEGLRVYNDAEYASYVESKGFDVVSHAAIRAHDELKRLFK